MTIKRNSASDVGNIESTNQTLVNTNSTENIISQKKLLVKCIVDEVGFKSKPEGSVMGAITSRMKQHLKEFTKELTLQELAEVLTKGHTIAVSHSTGGTGDGDFKASNSIWIDFDNGIKKNGKEEYFNDPITPEQVVEIATSQGLTVNLMYYSFRHKAPDVPVPKFRAVFILSEDITDPTTYKHAIEGIMSIFGKYPDKEVKGAVQRIYGTCNGLAGELNDKDTNDINEVLKLYSTRVSAPEVEKQKPYTTKAPPTTLQFDVNTAIENFNLLEYILADNPHCKQSRASKGETEINPCPLCGHKDHFFVNRQMFKTFGSGCGTKGGNIINYLAAKHNITNREAMEIFKYDILRLDKEEEDRVYRESKREERRTQANTSTEGLVMDEKGKPPFISIKVDQDGNAKESLNPLALAEYVRQHAYYKFVQESAKDTIKRYWYKDGYYQLINDTMMKGFIKQYVRQYDPKLASPNKINEAYNDLITDLVFTTVEELNTDENLINFQNGVLDLDTGELLPHSPKYLCTIQIPCNYSKEQKPTPVFTKFLKDLTALHSSPIDTQRFIMQYMGLAISNIKGYYFKKALFMVGKGDTGKSKLKSLTEALIGNRNITTIDLLQLEARFGASNLYNKRLAGCADMSSEAVKELATFKKVTGGDTLFSEGKYENGGNYKYTGLLWFCMNKLPPFTGDRGEWVYDRIVVFKCDNVIPQEKRNPKLDEDLFAEREGIVTRLVEALQSVRKAGYKLEVPPECREDLREYSENNSSVISFIHECLQFRKIVPDPKKGYTLPLIVSEDDPDYIKFLQNVSMSYYDHEETDTGVTKKYIEKETIDSKGKPYRLLIKMCRPYIYDYSDGITKPYIQKMYVEWCKNNQYKPEPPKDFYEELYKYFTPENENTPHLADTKQAKDMNGKNVGHCYRGLTITPYAYTLYYSTNKDTAYNEYWHKNQNADPHYDFSMNRANIEQVIKTGWTGAIVYPYQDRTPCYTTSHDYQEPIPPEFIQEKL